MCVATGPSLTAEDVAYCRGKATVLVVNDAYRFAPWAACLYSSDRYWWAYYGGVPAFTGLKVSIEHTPGRTDRRFAQWPITVLRNTGHDGLERDPSGLRTCAWTSGGAAVNLAVHLGASRIVLLGYDMGVTNGKTHFFGDHPAPINARHNFPTWRRAFETMREPLDSLGIGVFNCTRTTSLNAFPCVPLERAL